MTTRKFLLTAIVIVAGVSLSAQNKNQPVAARTGADAEWDLIRSVAYAPSSPELQGASDPAALNAAIGRQAARLHQSADQARNFYTKNPNHPKAVEARKIEALMLIQAVQSGDTAIEGRMEETVNAFSNDHTVPEAQRAEIAGTHSFSAVSHQSLSPEAMSKELERVARSLIVSFPTQPQGYESLLTIAQGQGEAAEKATLQELLTMPAPASVKEAVQLRLGRLNLVGKPLAEILADAGAKAVQKGLVSGKPTVVYTWASWSSSSIELGEGLAKRKADVANFVGVNLDSNQTTAQEFATQHKLAGALHYDARGINGALAKRLGVNAAPLVYLVDAKGIIQDVRGTENFDKKLTQLGL